MNGLGAWIGVAGPVRATLLGICALGVLKCGAGGVALLMPSAWSPVAPATPLVLLCFGAVAVKVAVRHPGWGSLFACLGAGFANGPLARAGFGETPRLEAFMAAVLWLAALEHPTTLVGWRRQLAVIPAGLSLAVAVTAILGFEAYPWPPVWGESGRFLELTIPLLAGAGLFLVARSLRPPIVLDTFLGFGGRRRRPAGAASAAMGDAAAVALQARAGQPGLGPVALRPSGRLRRTRPLPRGAAR